MRRAKQRKQLITIFLLLLFYTSSFYFKENNYFPLEKGGFLVPNPLENRISALEGQVKELLEVKDLILQSRQFRKTERIEELVVLVKKKGEVDVNELVKKWKISPVYARGLIKEAGNSPGVFMVEGVKGNHPARLLSLNAKNRLTKIVESIHSEFDKSGFKSISTKTIVESYNLGNGDCGGVVRRLLRKGCYRIERPASMLKGETDFSSPLVSIRRIE